jgi:hypothetical protein
MKALQAAIDSPATCATCNRRICDFSLQLIQIQENLFNIKMYHTPSGLRALTRIFVLVTPWLFG